MSKADWEKELEEFLKPVEPEHEKRLKEFLEGSRDPSHEQRKPEFEELWEKGTPIELPSVWRPAEWPTWWSHAVDVALKLSGMESLPPVEVRVNPEATPRAAIDYPERIRVILHKHPSDVGDKLTHELAEGCFIWKAKEKVFEEKELFPLPETWEILGRLGELAGNLGEVYYCWLAGRSVENPLRVLAGTWPMLIEDVLALTRAVKSSKGPVMIKASNPDAEEEYERVRERAKLIRGPTLV